MREFCIFMPFYHNVKSWVISLALQLFWLNETQENVIKEEPNGTRCSVQISRKCALIFRMTFTKYIYVNKKYSKPPNRQLPIQNHYLQKRQKLSMRVRGLPQSLNAARVARPFFRCVSSNMAAPKAVVGVEAGRSDTEPNLSASAAGDVKRPQFGTRFLSDPRQVFQHNAWQDHYSTNLNGQRDVSVGSCQLLPNLDINTEF